jgi:hypothetical protein
LGTGLELDKLFGGSEVDKAQPLAHPPAPVPLSYTIDSIIDYLLLHPDASPVDVAKEYKRPRQWFLTLLASDRFQDALDPIRHQLLDPAITSTMEERFRALALHSLNVMHSKLDHPEVTDFMVVKAAEIGVKALGLGMPKKEETVLTPVGNVDTIADRLLAALEKQRRNAHQPVTIEQASAVGDD